MPLKLTEVNEPSRIKDGIAERAGVSLRETFDLELYNNPVWKSVDKRKWRSSQGMSYEGQIASHVITGRQTQLGGSSKQNVAIMAA